MAFSAPQLEIEPEQLVEWMHAGDVVLVDVREPYEWDAGRIEQARHLEMERLASQADSIPPPRCPAGICRTGPIAGGTASGAAPRVMFRPNV